MGAKKEIKKEIKKPNMMAFKSTSEIKVSKNIVDQIIGQEHAIEVIKKAASQRRNVFLIGEPGTGKSMLGLALAELLPKSKLQDIVSLPNVKDENQPKIKSITSGVGDRVVEKAKIRAMAKNKNHQFLFIIFSLIVLFIPWWMRSSYGDIMAAASLIAGMLFIAALSITLNLFIKKNKAFEPKIIVNTATLKKAPFLDATGAHAGALLGDVLHDPLQSGGLGTPAHLRVESGMIHKANKGVLFIDEVALLGPKTQQELLTAMQEKKYPITGQSERSSGAMVRTEPVPCDFILVAAGNMETVQKMHPALRSRIRGYGYEVYMQDQIPDTLENRNNIAKFIAQEVTKDKKIPHFSRNSVIEVIKEAKKRSGRKGYLTLKLRDLGGLIRAAGDLALAEKEKLVQPKHIHAAQKLSRTLEQQISDKHIEHKKEYQVIRTKGYEVGRVNGLAVLGDSSFFSGMVLPIEAEIAASGIRNKIHATGKLGVIAKEAITNISAIIMKHFGEDIREKNDIYVQFLQTYDGLEGDSASISVATAVISALKNIPVRQDTALTGSLSVRGDVLPVGGITPKIEAAIEAGISNVIIPESNLQDVVLSKEQLKKIKIIPVKTINQVIKYAMVWKGKQHILKKFNK